MSDTHEIDYAEFPSIGNVSSRQFFSDAFGWNFFSFSPSYAEIRSAGPLAEGESG